MRIVMFSINPLFEGQVMGGAPKHLQAVAMHLGEQGHAVTVLCTRRTAEQRPFGLGDHVQVKPVLPYHQPFPQPYAIPAYDMAGIVQTLADHLQEADRFYMHDGEFLFPYVYDHLPTVVSLRDNVYPETILGGFLFRRDQMILNSEYSRRYYEQTVGRFLPGLSERIHVVPNGVDWARFRPTPPDEIRRLVPVDPAQHAIVLHPHRPEENKGIRQTLAVADLLVHRYGMSHLRVCMPRWLEADASEELRAFYRGIEAEIRERGLEPNFVFHEWIPQWLMPQYYTLGGATLVLGSYPEAFGNVAYESLGCGTPAVVARISSQREILPEHLIDKVDFADAEAAAEKAAAILSQGRRTSPETILALHERYGLARQMAGYAEVILGAQVTAPLAYRHATIDAATRFILPVWCYPAQRGIYHDFQAAYNPDPALRALVKRFAEGFTFGQAAEMGVGQDAVLEWLGKGYLTVTFPTRG